MSEQKKPSPYHPVSGFNGSVPVTDEQVVAWLRNQVKMQAGSDKCNAITLMHTPAAMLLRLAEIGLAHTPEAVGKRMTDGAIAREPIPSNVYFSVDHDNFYEAEGGNGLGDDFYHKWKRRWHEFPRTAADAKKDAKP